MARGRTLLERQLATALKPFAAFADPHRRAPASLPITSGSAMARRQICMGDCYAAADALAAYETATEDPR
jgi:hypothetical protein